MPITTVTLTGTASNYADRPFTAGDGNYGRSLDASEADAPSNLSGAVVGKGLYQDITAFLAALSNAYGTVYTSPSGTSQQLSPFAMLCMIRDAANFMLANRPVAH